LFGESESVKKEVNGNIVYGICLFSLFITIIRVLTHLQLYYIYYIYKKYALQKIILQFTKYNIEKISRRKTHNI